MQNDHYQYAYECRICFRLKSDKAEMEKHIKEHFFLNRWLTAFITDGPLISEHYVYQGAKTQSPEIQSHHSA